MCCDVMIPGIGGLVGKSRKLAGAYPSIVGSTVYNTYTNTTAAAGGIPSGTLTTDLCILSVCTGSGVGAATIYTPSGWTQIYQANIWSHPDNLNSLAVFYRTGATAGSTFSIGGSNASEWVTNVISIRGQYNNVPVGAGTYGSLVSSLNPPPVSPSWEDEYATLGLVIVGQKHNYRGVPSAPSGYTLYGSWGHYSHVNARLTIHYKNYAAFTEDPGVTSWSSGCGAVVTTVGIQGT